MVTEQSRPPLDGLKIAQVEKLTGVGSHTLRAWERRYGVPRPARSEGRQRLYSVQDVELIRRMQQLAERGVALSRAARTALQELEQRVAAGAIPHDNSGMIERFLDALLSYDERRATAIWSEALERHDLLTTLERLIIPALVQVGGAWHTGAAGVGQEHFASAFVRARLDALGRQVTPLPDAPVVLLACLAEERHELALLMLHVLLRFQGLATVYLGQDTPEDALVGTARDISPVVVCLNAGSDEAARRLPSVVSALTREVPTAAIVFGGKAVDENPALQEIPGATYGGPDLGAALAQITRLSRSREQGGQP